jgi:hypothetical protein
MSNRRAKVNASKLANAIVTALDGVKAERLTYAELTAEVGKVMGREVADIEGAIKTQANNTTSSDAKRAFFKRIVEKCGLVGGQGAPKDNTDWAAAEAALAALLGD